MRLPPRTLLSGGIGLIVAALALIAFTWGRIAGLDAVPLQLPYLVSGGVTAIALVLIGVTAINVHVKLGEEARRARQLEQVAELLGELHRHLGTGVDLDTLRAAAKAPATTTDPDTEPANA